MNAKRLMHSISLACLVLLLWTSCSEGERDPGRMFKKSTTLMNTLVTVTVVADSEKAADAAIEKAFREIGRLEELLSFWSATSEIAAVNAKAGLIPIAVDPSTFEVVERALYVSRRTAGAFDPTIGPVIGQWDFWNRKLPDPEKLKAALGNVGYDAILIDRDYRTVYLSRSGMSFDTGGIAKGYAADRAVGVLREQGISAGLVAVAGDIRAFGLKPDGRPWRVGVQNPRPKGNDDAIMATLELTDEAISTSGDYERYFIEGGRRYHHILNPRTGQPAEGLMSVTVVARRAVDTDGFSTGVFVMGMDGGLALLKDEGLEGILVDDQGAVRVTEGLRDRVTWTHKPAAHDAPSGRGR